MVVDGPVAMSYPCNGLKDYPFTIQCINPSTDLVVYYLPTGELDGSEIRLMYGVNYIITGKGMVSPATTVITTVLAYNAPAKIIITRSTRAERVADYDDYAAGPMGQVDLDLDRLYMILQEKNSNDQVLVIPGTCTAITGYSLLLPTEGAVHHALDAHASLNSAHGAVSAATPDTLMKRDLLGKTQIADGSAPNDAVTKQQLDTETSARISTDATKAPLPQSAAGVGQIITAAASANNEDAIWTPAGGTWLCVVMLYWYTSPYNIQSVSAYLSPGGRTVFSASTVNFCKAIMWRVA